MRNYSFLKATENQPMMTPFKPKSNHIDSNHFYPDKPSTSHIEYNYPYSDKPLTSRPLSYVDNSISSKPTDGHLSYSPNEASDLIPNDTNGFVCFVITVFNFPVFENWCKNIYPTNILWVSYHIRLTYIHSKHIDD